MDERKTNSRDIARRPLTLALAAGLALAACQTEGDMEGAQQPAATAITIGAGVAGAEAGGTAIAVTRSATDATTDGTGQQNSGGFAPGQTLTVFFPSGSSVSSARYTTGATDAGITACTTAAQPMFTAATATARGYYPAPVNATTTAFTVQQDQSSTDGYRRSDLMYATDITIDRTNIAATNRLTFQHRLSKLQLTLTPGAGVTEITAVRLVGGYRTIRIATPATMTLGTQTTPADPADLSDPLTESGAASEQTILVWQGTHTAGSGALSVSAIMPPQTLPAGRNLVEVDTNLGTVSLATGDADPATPDVIDDQVLESGKAYAASVSVQAQGSSALTLAVTPWLDTPAEQAVPAAGSNRVLNVNGVPLKMIYVPGNGSTIAGFYLAETETTNALWKAVTGSKPAVRTLDLSALTDGAGMSATDPAGQANDGDEYPVAYITHNEITSFIASLNTQVASQLSGYTFALPSVAQWQWAARDAKATAPYKYPGGNTVDEVAWYSTSNGCFIANAWGTTHPVAQLKPTALGFYDMAGNVQEWTADGGTNKTFCNGGYLNASAYLETGYTSSYGAGQKKSDLGFRLCLIADASATATSFTGNSQFNAWNTSNAANPTLTLDADLSTTENTTVTRDDGTIDFAGHKKTDKWLYLQNDDPTKTVTLKNGTVKILDGKSGEGFYSGNVVLDNMTVTDWLFVDGHSMTILSGTYRRVSNDQDISVDPRAVDVTIWDGAFGNKSNLSENMFAEPYNGLNYRKGTYLIYGGKFTQNPSAYSNVTIAPGYSVKANTGDDAAQYPWIVTAD